MVITLIKLQLFFFRMIKRYSQFLNVESTRRRANVKIHRSFSGGDSKFLFRGVCKELTIEKNVRCKNYCNFLIYPKATLIIHENVFFNNYCSISCLEKIEIGSNTIFGEGVKIYDHNHEYEKFPSVKLSKSKYSKANVSIGKDCWIASNVTILKGVTVGDNVIIGANCLIRHSIPSNSIVKHKEDLLVERLDLLTS